MQTFNSERLSSHSYGELDIAAALGGHNAVPLDLTRNPEACTQYWRASLEVIGNKVRQVFDRAFENGWIQDEDTLDRLRLLVLNSLCDSQTARIERNRKVGLDNLVNRQDPRVERAVAGTASPFDLLSLLKEYPKLGSIELAKLSHPLDPDATEAMDRDVVGAIRECGELLAPQPAYYKRKSEDKTTPAVVVLRKQPVTEFSTEAGSIQVVRRQAIMIRGDAEVLGQELNPHFDRMVKNPDRFDELARKIEGYYATGGRPCMDSVATTYYAKYLDQSPIELETDHQ